MLIAIMLRDQWPDYYMDTICDRDQYYTYVVSFYIKRRDKILH